MTMAWQGRKMAAMTIRYDEGARNVLGEELMPCSNAPLTGFFQSFVPVARPIKFSTPIGALSGNSVQVILPAVVSMIAVGWPAAAW